jgi:hypothetical protein
MADELDRFDDATNQPLKADPKVVKERMEREAKKRAEARKGKRASSSEFMCRTGRGSSEAKIPGAKAPLPSGA